MSTKLNNTHILSNLQKTESVANDLSKILKAGNIVAFYGDLGAGKTTFIKYLCEKMGVKEEVTSPTFTIINEYYAVDNLPIFHFDFYRLKNTMELRAINFDDYIYGDGICLIEWAEKIEEFLPEEIIKVKLWFNEKNDRMINIKAEY
ncbi:MAG: tRNA (adenosine(37)-N6)-threonylcarbamoyltransferase complex ATPase subunit type 1 TsaE [Calditrichia bacterium]|nr:tRNA (adenosine(37)-N6)-threonylcarbamoyltransferase complex ATPase subunit type 1 TsaE [Calditrichia bacterium]